jgi:predicted nucleic acid-binding protein
MILVDTSVLVDYLRARTPRVRKLLVERQAAICGVVRAELLCGARTREDESRIVAALAGFRSLEIPDSAWDDLGRHLFRLRQAGLAVPFQDALLATVAILHNIELWTTDGHFRMMQSALPELRLMVEPEP